MTKINEGRPVEAVELIEAEVRELVRRRGIDPWADGERIRDLVVEAVTDYEERAVRGGLPPLPGHEDTVRHLLDSVAGFGELQAYFDDPEVEEIWLNGPGEIFVARGGESERTGLEMSQARVEDLVERMLKTSGRRLDLSSPFVDASLPDGSRLHVVIPDITRRHWAVNIRKFVVRASRLEHLVELGSLTRVGARFLGAAVSSGLNILVSGATQAGKTSLLNCLTSAIGARERVITVEEVFELQCPLPDVVGLQCRQPNLEGEGEIPLRRLVKEALRMRPDRLIVGEVRSAESLDLLIAMNSGVGVMASVHANSARDAVTKICTLPLLAGGNISSDFVVPTVASCVDLVVHCQRQPNGRRLVSEIVALGRRVENNVIESSVIFALQDGALEPTGQLPPEDKFVRAGFRLHSLVGAA